MREQSEKNNPIALIKLAKAGSHDAYHTLRLQYRPLIDASVARHMTVDMSNQDRVDMYEEAERVFLNAIITYDTEQDGVDFGLYAKICLRNGLVSEIRRMHAGKRLGVVPLDASEAMVTVSEDPAKDAADAERFRYLYEKISAHLSPMENKVWWMYVSGVDVKTIAEKLQKEEKSIHNAIYRIRKKLRALLSDRT